MAEEATQAMRDLIADSISFLKARGVVFEPGLSDGEVEAVQSTFGFRFPPDLRAFLQTALPLRVATGRSPFPNWRVADPAALWDRLNWPFEGIAFDIEENAFWWKEWGPKPERLEDAKAVARSHVSNAPKLIPVYSHRYLPADPPLAGNPVFSVHQTDIIFYGTDLWHYFRNEFGPDAERWQNCRGMSEDHYYAAHRPIRFWTDLVRLE
jgi:hypothetical protein